MEKEKRRKQNNKGKKQDNKGKKHNKKEKFQKYEPSSARQENYKMVKKGKKPFPKQLSHIQCIALGFFIMITIGSLLLMLPVSSVDGQVTPFLDCLFTATSASCVTGLVVVDTYQHWSNTGQVILLMMIQVGGLGFMTVGVWFSVFLKKRVGIRERGLLQESLNLSEIGGLVRLVKKVVKGTFLFEGTGAVLLAFRFSKELGVARGIWYGIFHSISAFCNGGFDLMGRYGAYGSLCRYADDILVNVVVMVLILVGGIGFLVWDDISEKGLHVHSYRLHTKIVLSTTVVLFSVSTLLFYFMERNGSMQGMDGTGKVLASMFCAVTPRTAGFNTVDIAALSNGSRILTMCLMFIGGSPGSTAGGIKTTTLFVILACIFATFRNKNEIDAFRRRLPEEAVRKALLVFGVNLVLAVSAIFIICAVQPELPMDEVLFETFSAIGTAGMSTGVTRQLGSVARVAILLLMYCGRVGSLTFAMSLLKTKKTAKVKNPVERITIG